MKNELFLPQETWFVIQKKVGEIQPSLVDLEYVIDKGWIVTVVNLDWQPIGRLAVDGNGDLILFSRSKFAGTRPT